ncbi:MAG: peptidoglycan DD-metalloendopeptidase family protein [Desulfamplus sp.]|nr:peptidoglycan DD-metalloendopeptidase family protein [Desulfamplus sp.]
MKPSFKVFKSPYNANKITTITYKIFIIKLLVIFLFFSISALFPDNVVAGVKKNRSLTSSKASKCVSKNTKYKNKTDKNVVKKNKTKAKREKNLSKNNREKSKTNKSLVKNSNSKDKISKNRTRSRKTIAKNKNIEIDSKASGKQNISDREANVRIKQVSGIVKNTLRKTLVKMGLNKKLINHLSSIFKNTPALSNIQKGDIVQIAYQEKHINGKLVKTGVITAAIITSKKKSYQAYRFTYNGKHGYYDEKGNSLESSFLKEPLRYKEISSGFSARRLHPIKHIFQPHNGIDYAAPTGTPIKSVGNGVVIFKGYAESAGNYLKIKHPGTGISEYMHLSKFHKSMKVNKKVSKGDIIGYVGATGYATGPHLHLGFIVNNQYVDYRKLKLPHGTPLPKQFRNIFFQHVAMLNKQWNRNARREFSYNMPYSSIVINNTKHAL